MSFLQPYLAAAVLPLGFEIGLAVWKKHRGGSRFRFGAPWGFLCVRPVRNRSAAFDGDPGFAGLFAGVYRPHRCQSADCRL